MKEVRSEGSRVSSNVEKTSTTILNSVKKDLMAEVSLSMSMSDVGLLVTTRIYRSSMAS